MKIAPKLVYAVLLTLCSFLSTRAQNYALGFTSANSNYLDCGSNALLNASNIRTMECWVKFSSLTGDQEIMSRSTGGIGIEMLYYGGNLCFYCMKDASNYAFISYPGTNLATGVWYHIAVAFDGSTAGSMALYVNGVPAGTLTSAGSLSGGVANPGAGTSFRIGNWSLSTGPRLLNGTVDEARVWSVTRTQAQIKAGMYGTVAPGTTGLIAYYNMNNGSGTTASNSTANTGLDGTLVGSPAPAWVGSPIQFNSGALAFDGVDDRVTAPANSAYDISTGTVEFWAMPTAFPSGVNMCMVGVRGSTAARYSFHVNSSAVGIWNGSLFTTAPYTFTANQWYHFAFVCNGASTTVYVNGVAQTTTIGAFGTATGQPLIMGVGLNTIGFQEPFNGVLDEVRIWNVQRTAAQIDQTMNNTIAGPVTGLVAQFSMDQGIGSGTNTGLMTAIDATTTNNPGTLGNFALTGSSSNWTNHTMTTLPVIIAAFTGQRDGGAALLSWTTAQEENSRDFVIERSSDGQIFSGIATVEAAGTSHLARNYSYTDGSPASGVNYYRLKEEDEDGHANYSGIISINFSSGGTGGAAGVVLSPNPASTSITWNMTGAVEGPAVLSLNDLSGRTLLTRSFQLQQGANQVTVGLSGLPAGMYVLTMKQTNGIISKEFQLIK